MSKSVLLNLVTIATVVIVGFISYVNTSKTEKKGFVFTKTVFDEFHGKKELEKKLAILKSRNQQELDSLSIRLQKDQHNSHLINAFQLVNNNYMLQEEELSQKYTGSIWKQINQYISEYGKEHGYDFIFGASGDGSLMFANEANDLTEEIILYINKKYEDE